MTATLLPDDAVARDVIAHPASIIGGLRALVLQALHPLAMAGVAQHSDYRHRAMDRLRRTAQYVAATTFGDLETAEAAAARVRRVHRRVRGIDPITGRAYSADDPETQLWVHCVEWHSFLAAYRAYGPGLDRAAQDRYLAEGARVAALLGVPEQDVPATTDDLRAYFGSVRPQLCVSEASRGAIDFVLHPPLTRELAAHQPALRLFSDAAIAIVPRHLRALAGIDRPAARDALTVATTRPVVAAMGLRPVRELQASVLGTKRAAA